MSNKECDHDECAECHHLIAKGSGQEVIEEFHFPGLYLEYSKKEIRRVYCELHKKPYDKSFNTPCITLYYKKQSEYKRVNEDGTDYIEPKKK